MKDVENFEADFEIAEAVLRLAKTYGATDVDVMVSRSSEVSVRLANRALERSICAQTLTLGIRLFSGARQALTSVSDVREADLRTHIKAALEMAKWLPEDPLGALAEPSLTTRQIDTLAESPDEVYDTDAQWRDAHTMEENALHVPGIERSWSVETSWDRRVTTYMNTKGFEAQRRRSYFSRSLVLVASNGSQKERDYDAHTASSLSRLKSPEDLAKRAAQAALTRLGGRSLASCQAPVVFPPRQMRQIIGFLISTLSGQAVANCTSFLQEDLGKTVFSKEFSLIDDPLRPQYLGARKFDCEGTQCAAHSLIEEGILKSWLLDHRSARRLHMRSLGHAQRSLDSQPAPHASTLFCPAGTHDTKKLVHSLKTALEIHEIIGSGFNPVTGDFSFGISGVWLEKGTPCFPVHKVTLAGNLRDVFQNLTLGNDLSDTRSINTPTGVVTGLTIGGTA